jgi:maleate isomerase
MQRLGVILPSSNTTVEYEVTKILQNSEISCHFARVPLKDVTVRGLECMDKAVEDAAILLGDADVNLIAFACTSGSLIKGREYDFELSDRISEAAGCPAITTSSAVIDALNVLKAHRICLGTPYIEEVTDREVSFLEKNGFIVTAKRSLHIKENKKIGLLTPNDAEVLARSICSSVSDVVFISCTNFRTFEVIERLEDELGKAVISSNSATLWASLKALDIKCSNFLGRLSKI